MVALCRTVYCVAWQVQMPSGWRSLSSRGVPFSHPYTTSQEIPDTPQRPDLRDIFERVALFWFTMYAW